MEKLKCADPPLLLKEDVRKFCLLHWAVNKESLEMVKYLVKLDPSCIYYNHSKYGIPLKQLRFYKDDNNAEKKKMNHLEIIKYLVHAAVSYDASHYTIGGLFVKGNGDNLILDSLIEMYGQEDIWCSIKQALSSFNDLPILHQVIKHCPSNINHMIAKFPNAALVRDDHNRLPIHIALEFGIE